MLFNSPIYIFLFLPIAVAWYFLLIRYRMILAGKSWLVLASQFFCGYWNLLYLPLIVGSMLVNFGIGTVLSKAPASGRHAV